MGITHLKQQFHKLHKTMEVSHFRRQLIHEIANLENEIRDYHRKFSIMKAKRQQKEEDALRQQRLQVLLA